MFNESAQIYDLVYSFKDYKKESEEISEIIRAKNEKAKTILDIGCGTAEHHKYLKDFFQVDGIDINREFIQIAAGKNQKGRYTVADMSSFDLNKTYDVIMCLFSSIGYLKTVKEIISALQCFNRHLAPDGILIIEPWFTPENYTGKTGMSTFESEHVKICRMAEGHSEGTVSVLNFQYLLATKDQGIRHFKERHELRLTSKDEMINAFREAGFDVSFDSNGLTGRGMYYGTKKNN